MTVGALAGWDAMIADAKSFRKRCESALNVAVARGEADWRIASLREAVSDAKAAEADMRRCKSLRR